MSPRIFAMSATCSALDDFCGEQSGGRRGMGRRLEGASTCAIATSFCSYPSQALLSAAATAPAPSSTVHSVGFPRPSVCEPKEAGSRLLSATSLVPQGLFVCGVGRWFPSPFFLCNGVFFPLTTVVILLLLLVIQALVLLVLVVVLLLLVPPGFPRQSYPRTPRSPYW